MEPDTIKVMERNGKAMDRRQYGLEGTISFSMSIKVVIDQEGCTQCGLCYSDECPEVFVEGSDGTSEIASKYQDGSPDKGSVPDDLKECVQKAVDVCPVSAISIP